MEKEKKKKKDGICHSVSSNLTHLQNSFRPIRVNAGNVMGKNERPSESRQLPRNAERRSHQPACDPFEAPKVSPAKGAARLTSASSRQQIAAKSALRNDRQLKALRALMLSKEILMRRGEGEITSLEVKWGG